MKKLFIIIFTAVLLLLGFLSAPAASADDAGLTPYFNQFRNNGGLPSLATNEQLQDQAQNWANKLAASDGSASTDPAMFNPAPTGFEGGRQIPGVGMSGADYVFVEGNMEKQYGDLIRNPAWNTLGVGTAKSGSGKVYVVLNLATINVRTVAPAPAPVPAPVAVPAPIPVQVPEPVPAVVPEPVPAETVDTPSAPEPIVEPQPQTTEAATPTPVAEPSVVASPVPTTSVSPTPRPTVDAEPETSSEIENLQSTQVVEKGKMTGLYGSLAAGFLLASAAGQFWRKVRIKK